jgi:uncharacterized phage protein gp47/JayE
LYRLAGAIIGASGEAIMDIEAVEPGIEGNLNTGDTLTLVSPVPGINSNLVVIEPGILGGTAIESDASLRERIIKVIQSPPYGGNKADYENWALEVSGVKHAFCFPLMNGLGTVGVAIWGEPENPVLAPSIVDKAWEYIKKKAPVTAGPGVYVYTPAMLRVDITLRIEPDDPDVRDNIINNLKDRFDSEGKPGVKIPKTHIAETISISAGEYDHQLISPAADILPSMEQLPVLGDVTFLE